MHIFSLNYNTDSAHYRDSLSDKWYQYNDGCITEIDVRK